jgi:hypothetical protein
VAETVRLRADKLEWRIVDDEVIALDLGSSEYLAINRVGAVLWPALAEGVAVDALVELVTTEFDVDRERVADDVEAFLATLERRDLLTRDR